MTALATLTALARKSVVLMVAIMHALKEPTEYLSETKLMWSL